MEDHVDTFSNYVILSLALKKALNKTHNKTNCLAKQKGPYAMKKSDNFNRFPHIDAFGRLCIRRLFENIVTKEEIAQNVQFLLLPQCFPLSS